MQAVPRSAAITKTQTPPGGFPPSEVPQVETTPEKVIRPDGLNLEPTSFPRTNRLQETAIRICGQFESKVLRQRLPELKEKLSLPEVEGEAHLRGRAREVQTSF